jgi:U3 small nucleolar RNA-associated protein 10
MSDLLDQLRKRKQQEGGAGFKSIHVRPSLLFEYKEAAKIELTAIHLLAINGFEQLVKQEPRIKPFEQTLFAPASKEITRESQTADVNKRLDESIESLLGLLSPYFLLKATHKCLEFLIRRYKYAHIQSI